jgi:dihydroorotase
VTSVSAAAAYRDRIVALLPQTSGFTPLMTLYLTDNTQPSEIRHAKASGFVHGVKYYPAGATTNSDSGVSDIRKCFATLEAMSELGVPLLIHGEVTDPGVDVFDREKIFIEQILIALVGRFPGLRIVLEHITTANAVKFVLSAPDNVAARCGPSSAAERNDIFRGGIRPHHYCLPILKREASARLVKARYPATPSSSWEPTVLPMQGTRRRRSAVARAFTLRMRESSSMPRRSAVNRRLRS